MRRGAMCAARASLAVAACLLVAAPVAAERELLDRVAAMVEGEAILLSEVIQEMNLLRLQRNLGNLTAEQQEQLFRKVLSEMIDERLLVAQAKARGFEVSDPELQAGVDDNIRAIKERIGDEERYREELQRQDLTEAELRDIYREQERLRRLAQRVVATEIRRHVDIPESAVRQAFETERDSLPPELLRTPELLRLAHILIVPQADSARVRAARAKIDTAARRVAAGEDFAAVARQLSEWPTAASGGQLGSFRYGDFGSDEFDRAVSQLEPGQMSPVFESRFGLQIVKLEARDGEVMSARHIVVKMDADENALVGAFEKAQELRQRIQRGESFEDLARMYSDDVNSSDRGGVLERDWPRDELRLEFRAPIDSVAAGSVTSVIRTAAGFHLLKVLSRTASRPAAYEDAHDLVRRWLEQREVDRRTRTYLDNLRQQFTVDIKV